MATQSGTGSVFLCAGAMGIQAILAARSVLNTYLPTKTLSWEEGPPNVGRKLPRSLVPASSYCMLSCTPHCLTNSLISHCQCRPGSSKRIELGGTLHPSKYQQTSCKAPGTSTPPPAATSQICIHQPPHMRLPSESLKSHIVP